MQPSALIFLANFFLAFCFFFCEILKGEKKEPKPSNQICISLTRHKEARLWANIPCGKSAPPPKTTGSNLSIFVYREETMPRSGKLNFLSKYWIYRVLNADLFFSLPRQFRPLSPNLSCCHVERFSSIAQISFQKGENSRKRFRIGG